MPRKSGDGLRTPGQSFLPLTLTTRHPINARSLNNNTTLDNTMDMNKRIPNKLEYKTVLYYKVLVRYKTVFFGTISVQTGILLYKTVSYRLKNYSMI